MLYRTDIHFRSKTSKTAAIREHRGHNDNNNDLYVEVFKDRSDSPPFNPPGSRYSETNLGYTVAQKVTISRVDPFSLTQVPFKVNQGAERRLRQPKFTHFQRTCQQMVQLPDGAAHAR